MPLADIPGYSGYQAARLRNQQQETAQLQQFSTLQTILANIQKADQSKMLLGANPAQLKDPDFWSRMAVAQNKPEYETHAERLRKDQQNETTLETMRGAKTVIQPDPQEVAQAADQGSVAPQAVTARAGGIFDDLAQSPNPQIAQQAKALKASMERADKSIAPQYWQTQQSQLAARETALLNRPERQARAGHVYSTGQGYFKEDENGVVQPVLGPDGKPLAPQSAGNTRPMVGDFTKSGEDFLKSLPDVDRGLVKKVASYDIDPKTLSTRDGQRERVLTMVSQYDPTYDDTQYANKRRAIMQFGSGPLGATTKSLNVAIEHIDTLKRAGEALKNGQFTPGNKTYNEVAKAFGLTPANTFEGIRDIVANEVVKGTIGNSGALADRAEAAAKVKASSSPEQLNELLNGWVELMGGQVKGLERQYEASTRNKDFRTRYLTQRTQDAIEFAESRAKPKAPASSPTGSGWGIRPL